MVDSEKDELCPHFSLILINFFYVVFTRKLLKLPKIEEIIRVDKYKINRYLETGPISFQETERRGGLRNDENGHQ